MTEVGLHQENLCQIIKAILRMAFMQPRDGETPLEVQDTRKWGEADKRCPEPRDRETPPEAQDTGNRGEADKRCQEPRDGETPPEVQHTGNRGEADKIWQELSSGSNGEVGQQELQTKTKSGWTYLVGNWILTSCPPRRATSGQSSKRTLQNLSYI